MKKISAILSLALIPGALFASDTATNTVQTTGNLTNYEAVKNIALAQKSEFFLNKVVTLANDVENYILDTGSLDINNNTLKTAFLLDDDIFKNFDGENDLQIYVDNTGIYFYNVYDNPTDTKLYYLQNAPNYPTLMKIYKDSDGNYVLYLPFSKKVKNMIKTLTALENKQLIVPQDYQQYIDNATISSTAPSSGTNWIKPNGDGSFTVLTKDDNGWKEVAVITSDGLIKPLDNIVGDAKNLNNNNNVYAINTQEVENKIVVDSLDNVDINSLKEGTVVIVDKKDENTNETYTYVYVKMGDKLQPVTIKDFSKETEEINKKIYESMLKSNLGLLISFNKTNYDPDTHTLYGIDKNGNKVKIFKIFPKSKRYNIDDLINFDEEKEALEIKGPGIYIQAIPTVFELVNNVLKDVEDINEDYTFIFSFKLNKDYIKNWYDSLRTNSLAIFKIDPFYVARGGLGNLTYLQLSGFHLASRTRQLRAGVEIVIGANEDANKNLAIPPTTFRIEMHTFGGNLGLPVIRNIEVAKINTLTDTSSIRARTTFLFKHLFDNWIIVVMQRKQAAIFGYDPTTKMFYSVIDPTLPGYDYYSSSFYTFSLITSSFYKDSRFILGVNNPGYIKDMIILDKKLSIPDLKKFLSVYSITNLK